MLADIVKVTEWAAAGLSPVRASSAPLEGQNPPGVRLGERRAERKEYRGWRVSSSAQLTRQQLLLVVEVELGVMVMVVMEMRVVMRIMAVTVGRAAMPGMLAVMAMWVVMSPFGGPNGCLA